MELLFECREGIGFTEGKIEFIQCVPEVMPEPVLRGDPDRKTEDRGVNVTTVLNDGGVLRMWYKAYQTPYRRGLAGYAESDDGITWRKPRLGLVEHEGSKDNNICFDGFVPMAFIDPTAPASHRYRATSCCSRQVMGVDIGQTNGYFTAHSADGIEWHLDDTKPRWAGGDVVTSIYHSVQKRGIAAMKRVRRMRYIRRRSIAEASLRDGVWSADHLALVPDEYDDVCAAARGFATSDYYGMGMMPSGQGTVGFIWQLRQHPPYRTAASSGTFGVTDVTLAFQAKEGERWIHMPGRMDFLSHGPYDWNMGGGMTATAPVTVGNETRLYFTGNRYGHSWAADLDFKSNPKWQKHVEDGGPLRCIGYARWPNHRLFGFRGAPEGFLTLDLGEVTEPSELFINCQADAGGSVRIELINQEGHSLDDCVPLEADHLESKVAWKHGTTIRPPSNGPRVSARLHLDWASVYAFEVRPAK